MDSSSAGSVKEKVNVWIHHQVESFLDRWTQPDKQHPALEAVRKLTDAVEKLNLSSSNNLEPLKVCTPLKTLIFLLSA